MTQFINKSTIKAEIERLIKEYRLSNSAEAKYRCEAYNELLDFINTLAVLTLDDIKEMENHAFLHGIEVERNKNIFKNKEIKI